MFNDLADFWSFIYYVYGNSCKTVLLRTIDHLFYTWCWFAWPPLSLIHINSFMGFAIRKVLNEKWMLIHITYPSVTIYYFSWSLMFFIRFVISNKWWKCGVSYGASLSLLNGEVPYDSHWGEQRLECKNHPSFFSLKEWQGPYSINHLDFSFPFTYHHHFWVILIILLLMNKILVLCTISYFSK